MQRRSVGKWDRKMGPKPGGLAMIPNNMRVLVYKRTHNGDPNPNGCFGSHDCMGMVRARRFDAVIGVGGIGPKPRANGIAGQINWIGIGPHRTTKRGHRGPVLTFDHFIDFGTDGPDFEKLAPKLSKRIYSNNIRHLIVGLPDENYREAQKILRLAEEEPPSPKRIVGGRRATSSGRRIARGAKACNTGRIC